MKLVSKYNYVLLLHFQSRSLGNTSRRNTHKLCYDAKTPVEQKNLKVSTLYVPGRFAGEIYQILKPLINVNYIEENKVEIENSCRVRGIKLDLQYTINILKEWMSKREQHQKINDKIKECQEEAKRLKQLKMDEEAESMNKNAAACLDELKLRKEDLYEVEDVVMPLAQKIPNIIDLATPIEADSIKVHLEPSTKHPKTLSHVDIATNLSLLECCDISPTAYYYKGSLAELEMLAQDYFSSKLQEFDFAPMSNVDFCKSFILEATGLDPHSYDQCIPLKGNKPLKVSQNFNLVGGASFESFCAYFTNMNTKFETLPAKYFALGRHYEARNKHSNSPSLFSVVQSSRIHSVILTDKTNEGLQFDYLVNILLSSFSPLKIPFRTVDVAALNLNCSESRRMQLELWSPAQLQFVPVAHVSQRNDFISRRLHITYGVQYTVHDFCSIVEGVVVNIPVLLGCVIENYIKSNESIDFEEIINMFNKS